MPLDRLIDKEPRQFAYFHRLMGYSILSLILVIYTFTSPSANYQLYIYPRISEGVVAEVLSNHPHITRIAAPIIELSATFIRDEIKARHNVRPLLPEKVWQYIDKMGLYLK